MLRDDLSHVLSRARRAVIRKRAPRFHRWQHLRQPASASDDEAHGPQRIDVTKIAVADPQFVFVDLGRDGADAAGVACFSGCSAAEARLRALACEEAAAQVARLELRLQEAARRKAHRD